MLTYLAQLSWNPGDYKKVFLMTELIERIDFSKLSKNNPEFDYDKLMFLNSKAIQAKPASDIHTLLIMDENFNKNYKGLDRNKKEKFIELIKPRMKSILDFKAKFAIYFNSNCSYKEEDIKKVLSSKNIYNGMDLLIKRLNILDTFDKENTEILLREAAKDMELKAADLIHPCRLAITTETVSPGIFEVIEFFGKAETIKRLNNFLAQVKTNVLSN